jgi:micrococcal nuclease
MKRLISVFLGIAILFGCILYYFPEYLPKKLMPTAQTLRYWVKELEQQIWPESEQSPDALSYDVIRAIDGDTLLVSMYGIETMVRLIGIDAPESVHPDEEKNTAEGEQASLWMKQYIAGKRVMLEYDQELNDRYGRTLAYVYVDNMLLEDVLLTMGLARTLTMEPNTRYQHHFEMLEKEARDSGSGFWGTGFFVK